MAQPSDPIPPSVSGHWAMLALCLSMGLIGVIASKGIVLLVSLVGLAGLAAWIFGNRPDLFLPRLPAAAVAALIAWAAISAFWTLDGTQAATLCLRLAGLCLAGFIMLHITNYTAPEIRERLKKALLIGYGLGLLVLIIGYVYVERTGDSLWSSFYNDPLTTLNNGAVVMALLLWPVAAIVWYRIHPAATVLLFSAIIGGFLFLSSGAALLSIVSGLIAFFLVLFYGRPAGLTIGAVIAVFFLIAPTMTEFERRSGIFEDYVSALPSSTEHRLLMWDFVTTKIDEKPLFGWGMDSSRHLPQEDFRLSPNTEIMPLHPHDAALQIRLELGWPGVIIAAGLIFAVFWSMLIADTAPWTMAVRSGAAVAYLSVGAVSYGVWQNWWIATAWALAAIVSIVTPHEAP